MLCSGYMAPEYAMDGKFSSKSDVYSYGVLTLEIVSGQKNSSSQNGEVIEDLLNFVSMNAKPFFFVANKTFVKHTNFKIMFD